MKNVFIIFLIVLYSSSNIYSQGENNNWYFGDKATVNFSTTIPSPLFDSQMTQLESVASMSNASGGLLFYTNGINVWNRQHQIMSNGSGLLGNDTTEQIIILPHPGNSNLYYVFTMSYVFASSCNIVYSIIDMSSGSIGLDGNPLGAVSVVVKNIPLLNEIGSPFTVNTEAITSTANNNNNGYWILIPNNTHLYSYRLDNTGFINNPVLSTLSFPLQLNEYSQIRVSPNLPSNLSLSYSNLVAITLWNNVTQANSIRINSFDNNTGLLSSLYSAPIGNTNAYSTEFSSDGLLLYAGIKSLGIYVFDLFNTNPSTNTRTVTNQNLNYATIQRGTNNEMYVSVQDNSYLSRIMNPNSFSLSTFTLNSIDLNNTHIPSRFCKLGLPQLVPILPQAICIPNRILSWTETSSNTTYLASNIINTNNNYLVNSGQDITLKAGASIVLSPNTLIKADSKFWAKIESCTPNSSRSISDNSTSSIENTFNVKTTDNYIRIYPNPVTNGKLYITSDSGADKTVAIYDILGKQVMTTALTNDVVNVSALNAGVYIVRVTEAGNTATRKLVIR